MRLGRICVPRREARLIPPRFGKQICDREGKAEVDSEKDLQDPWTRHGARDEESDEKSVQGCGTAVGHTLTSSRASVPVGCGVVGPTECGEPSTWLGLELKVSADLFTIRIHPSRVRRELCLPQMASLRSSCKFLHFQSSTTVLLMVSVGCWSVRRNQSSDSSFGLEGELKNVRNCSMRYLHHPVRCHSYFYPRVA